MTLSDDFDDLRYATCYVQKSAHVAKNVDEFHLDKVYTRSKLKFTGADHGSRTHHLILTKDAYSRAYSISTWSRRFDLNEHIPVLQTGPLTIWVRRRYVNLETSSRTTSSTRVTMSWIVFRCMCWGEKWCINFD